MHLLFWTSVSTVGLSERGLNLGYLTCNLMAMCCVLCRELVLGFWGSEPETNLKWLNTYWSCAPPIFGHPSRPSVCLERGLNLGYLTCNLMAMCHVLCRELVLEFWGSEPETNLKRLNIYWSCAPPILDVRLDQRSVRGVWTQMILHVAMVICYVLCRELVLEFCGLESETNLKWINIKVVHLLLWTSISAVG